MIEKEPSNSGSEHISAIEDLIAMFDDAGAGDGIKISAVQARYIVLFLKHYLGLVKKLNGIWR